MGKTYEALKRAEKERQQKRLEIVQPAQNLEPRKEKSYNRRKYSHLEPYEHLKTSILARYGSPNKSIKTIMFNSTSSGDGCSTTAMNFAATLATDPDLNVLLVEVNLRTPSLIKRLNIGHAPDLNDLVANLSQMTARIEKVESENLYVIGCGGGSLLGALGLFESGEFDQFLKTVRKRFDYVILDAPPVPVFSEFRVLCSKVDGIVLVVKSDETRRQVALRAKKEIEAARGNLIGVVLNKRKYYIPKWIYKRL
jgi:protein-tyrosine kinase